MKNLKKAKLHTSDFLDNFLSQISEEEQIEVTTRMKLAAAIDDAMKSQNISKSQLAIKVNKENSVITKWLSGRHNFTMDTLDTIGGALGIKLTYDYKASPVAIEKKILKKSQIPIVKIFFTERFQNFVPFANYSTACI